MTGREILRITRDTVEQMCDAANVSLEQHLDDSALTWITTKLAEALFGAMEEADGATQTDETRLDQAKKNPLFKWDQAARAFKDHARRPSHSQRPRVSRVAGEGAPGAG